MRISDWSSDVCSSDLLSGDPSFSWPGRPACIRVKFGPAFLDFRIMTLEVFDIESLDLEARGIARREGKVVFVEGALPGEKVLARVVKQKASFDTARMERILKPSSQRVEPPCPYFGVCGGCAMQHLERSEEQTSEL